MTRAWLSALCGAVAGAAATCAVLALRPEPREESIPPDPEVARAIERIAARLARLEQVRATRPPPVDLAPPAPAEGGTDGASDPATAPAPVAPDPAIDFTKVSSEDLALQADERHLRDTEVAGAVARYRELLARGGTPSERRYRLIRLGDCLSRLGRDEEAMRAYRDCVDASTEDHHERVACMLSLARWECTGHPAEARRWIDRALELEWGRNHRTVHALSADLARDAQQSEVEIRELQWLVEHDPQAPDVTAWTRRIAELRGEGR